MKIKVINISIAEVIEVRGYGLNAPELLSVAVSAADKLPLCPRGVVFDTENVYITNSGGIVIETVSSSNVEPCFIPPEWAKGEEDAQAAAVYCLGAVLRAAGAEEASDVDLFSLVNIMTVAMTGTRPTAHRMGQMARNQLHGRDPASMLMCIYEELMGDEESNRIDVGDLDDLDDEFLSNDGMRDDDDDDDYRGQVVITGNNNIKRAVEYFEDDQRDEAFTSTSSSNNSSEKDSFYGEAQAPLEMHKPRANDIIEHKEVREESPVMFEDTTLGGIGSPLSQSTRLDETYIEEKSIDMGSFNKSPSLKSPFEDDFVKTEKPIFPKTVVQPPTPTEPATTAKSAAYNPFEDDENEFHGGTLSGRDPFDDESNDSRGSRDALEKKHELHKKEPVTHRLSSSSEEIIEATIHEDDFDDELKYTSPLKPKPIPEISEKEYDAESDNSPPLHHYSAVPIDNGGITPLEEAQRALRANKARHKPSILSNQNDAPPPRQRYSNVSDYSESSKRMRRDEEESIDEVDATPKIAEIVASTRTEPTMDEPKSARPHRYRKSMEVEEEAEQEQNDKEDIDSYFEKYKKKSTPILSADTPQDDDDFEMRKQIPAAVVPAPPASDFSPALHRRNSLLPSRISGRQSKRRSVTSVSSMRGKRKTRAIPEFYDLTRHQNIRLRAPISKKKRLSLHRVEETEVIVELLNGQKIEVACRSDVVSHDIFSLIVQNMNINEHVFFGLSFLRDGEHFFIEDQQRLEKFAPPGWKSVSKVGTRVPYVLHLRFKFYPQILDFIKTDVTMNELFLQCRRDILEKRIQPKRDAAFELAALALQAEFGNRPPPVISDYFDTQHYLPKQFCSFEDPIRLKGILAELHGHYSGTRMAEAKSKYIQICQRHADFGCHLHRVFRTKPSTSHGASPFDPDTGSSIYIGIMPRGISIYEQQGGNRELLAEHLWPQTQTLQFDKKRFVIVAVDTSEQQIESTFYTDHHTKSAYFVRFAAAQHRWMMKMRQWKSTLRHENTMQAMPDVIVEGRTIPPAPIKHDLEATPPSSPLLDAADKIFAKMPDVVEATPPPPQRPTEKPPSIPKYDTVDEGIVCDSQAENFERLTPNADDEETPRSMQFDVTLTKDPANGLGLTLVDGNLNGVPGVYVKLVADNV
ncbi:unnamed protein product [Caenorhabditis bovis]|uniref:FERM domain-containing protein n=1 Tax=Caenorhabditis bovis TaxID=2654633 RepID=A0A8S1FB00_9PELO|nr:unnamed protein product [Caenorhabditis bovis]